MDAFFHQHLRIGRIHIVNGQFAQDCREDVEVPADLKKIIVCVAKRVDTGTTDKGQCEESELF